MASSGPHGAAGTLAYARRPVCVTAQAMIEDSSKVLIYQSTQHTPVKSLRGGGVNSSQDRLDAARTGVSGLGIDKCLHREQDVATEQERRTSRTRMLPWCRNSAGSVMVAAWLTVERGLS